jgi:uncharacterized membrane protein YoaT (DUF817 family)
VAPWWGSSSRHRCGFLFLAALAIQAGMLTFRLETFEEAKVILVFHIVGTMMELFKTAVGSWVYPEDSLFRIGGVPLFSGFMYASIGSYIARGWRLFDFRFTGHPPIWTLFALSLGIYANFYVDHYAIDLRLLLIRRSRCCAGAPGSTTRSTMFIAACRCCSAWSSSPSSSGSRRISAR